MISGLLKALYFALLFFIFAVVQWYVSHAYIRWVRHSVKPESQEAWYQGGLYFLIGGNVIFALRFLLTQTGYYDYWLAQYIIIYPGAMFFSAVTLTAVAVLLYDIPRQSQKLISKIIFWYKSRKLTEDAPVERTDKLPNQSRRKFIKYAGAAIVTAPFILTISTTSRTARDYRILRPELFFEDLPAGLDGLRIVQISDIHSGMYMTEYQISEIVEIANSLNPELVAITGDFVDSAPSEIPAVHNALKELKSEYGVFGCLGNHDHYASGHSVSNAMESAGIRMLNNSGEELRINNESLGMLGIDDAGRRHRNYARMEQAISRTRPDIFRIMLSHRPEQFIPAADNGIQLTLAGHTHGGQIGGNVLGIPMYPINLLHDYTHGLYHYGDKKLYVNVGVGMVGVPVRVVRPEITEITLRKKITA